MSSEMAIKRLDLTSPGLSAIVDKDNLDFLAMVETHKFKKIIQVAQKIVPAVCSLEENQGKTGVMIAISKRELGFPILTVQIGEVNDPDASYGPDGKRGKYADFADRKALVLQLHPEFIASSENSTLPVNRRMRSSTGIEIPGGAIAVRDWIISTSAFKNANMDTITSLAIAAGAGILGLDEIEQMAHDPRVNCTQEFMRNEDRILIQAVPR